MAKSTYLEKVDALSKAASTLIIRGHIFEDLEALFQVVLKSIN
jgi:hypothetical protein